MNTQKAPPSSTENGAPNIVRPVQFQKAETRVNGTNRLPQSFPVASQLKIMANFDKAASKLATQKEAETIKARKLAVKLMSKKKVAFSVFQQLQEAGVPVQATVGAIISVAEGMVAGELATADTITKLAGDRPEAVTARWWSEKFPELLDFIGITEKKSKTERRFVELWQLQNRCSVLSNAVYCTGDVVCSAADKLAGKLITTSPYIEHTKSGELILHQKPADTPEGKEAKRKADLATYLAKQHKREVSQQQEDSGSIDLDYIVSYKKPAMVTGLVIAVLFGVASMQPEKSPNLEIQQAAMPGLIETIKMEQGE